MNKDTLNLHLEILDKERQEVLEKLLFLAKDFVLGGGTALALQLNHRKSFDFDFFSSSSIPKNLLEKITKIIPVENIAIDTSDELTFFTKDAIKLTFLFYPFVRTYPIIRSDYGLSLFPIKEIAIQKAYTIGRRGEYRDYYDLYFILNNNYIDLKEIISEAKKVYEGAFDEKIFLQQLVYFGDISNFNITPVSNNTLLTPDDVKRYFEDLVKSFV